MRFTKDDFLKGAARWKARKAALIDISQSDGSQEAVMEAFHRCFPNDSWAIAELFLRIMDKEGYITGLELSKNHVILPVTIRLTQAGEEYFDQMAAEALKAAEQLDVSV